MHNFKYFGTPFSSMRSFGERENKKMWQNSVPFNLLILLTKDYYALNTHQWTKQVTNMDSASLPHFPEHSTVSGSSLMVNKYSIKEH